MVPRGCENSSLVSCIGGEDAAASVIVKSVRDNKTCDVLISCASDAAKIIYLQVETYLSCSIVGST